MAPFFHPAMHPDDGKEVQVLHGPAAVSADERRT